MYAFLELSFSRNTAVLVSESQEKICAHCKRKKKLNQTKQRVNFEVPLYLDPVLFPWLTTVYDFVSLQNYCFVFRSIWILGNFIDKSSTLIQ